MRDIPELMPYQTAGAEFIAERAVPCLTDRPTAYLADDPGLGKTAQVIRAADLVGARRILVVSPASLKENWLREFRKFSPADRPTQIPNPRQSISTSGSVVCVVNYDIAVNPQLHGKLAELPWDMLVCDEAHALKNPASKRTRALLGERGLFRHAASTVLISGTPALNHPGELYSALHSLHGAATRGLDYETWLRRYCHVAAGEHGPKVMGNKPEIAELKAALDGFLLRRRRADVLTDMPPLRVSRLTVENQQALAAVLGAEETDVTPDLRALLRDEDMPDAALDEIDEAELSTIRRLAGNAKAHALIPVLQDELDSGMEKIVLMCWHRSTMDILQRGLERYGVARIDGSTKNRQFEVDRFQSSHYSPSCRVFIGQLQAAGAGLTLTAAANMVIVEPSWVPGENVQAMLRIHRIGQHHPCLVRFAALAGSIDEAIMSVAERKARLLAELL